MYFSAYALLEKMQQTFRDFYVNNDYERHLKVTNDPHVVTEPKKPDRDRIHIMSGMHMKVTWLEFLGVIMLIYVGYILGDFWDSSYFSVGPPVMTRDVNVDTQWKYWLLIAVIAWDRLFAFASSEIVGNWRINHVLNPMSPEYTKISYSKAMFVLMVDHIVNFLRGAVMILFIYAQVDFAMAFAIPDIIIGIGASIRNIRNLEAKKRIHKVAKEKGCKPEDIQRLLPAGDMEHPPNKKLTGWQMSPMLLTFFQILELVLFVLVFYFIGYFDTPYFLFVGPFYLFGKTFQSTKKLWGFFVFVLIDAVFSTLHNAIAGPYILSFLLNNSSLHIQGTKGRAMFIYIGKKVIGWIRVIFMLNFILSKFPFLLATFISDFCVTWFMFHRSLMAKKNKEHEKETKEEFKREDTYSIVNYAAYKPLSPYYMTWVAIAWMVFVVIFSMAQLRIYKYPYFNWPPPLTVFETVITKGIICGFIIGYTIVDRAINTLASEIALPYIANVITGCDPEGLEYNPGELFAISFMYDATNWLRRMVAYNFVFSNISLVVFQGFTDVVVSWMIIVPYLRYKTESVEYLAAEERQKFVKSVKFKPTPEIKAPEIELVTTTSTLSSKYEKILYQHIVYEKNLNDALNPALISNIGN